MYIRYLTKTHFLDAIMCYSPGISTKVTFTAGRPSRQKNYKISRIIFVIISVCVCVFIKHDTDYNKTYIRTTRASVWGGSSQTATSRNNAITLFNHNIITIIIVIITYGSITRDFDRLCVFGIVIIEQTMSWLVVHMVIVGNFFIRDLI